MVRVARGQRAEDRRLLERRALTRQSRQVSWQLRTRATLHRCAKLGVP